MRFWVLSNNFYNVAAAFAGFVLLAVLAWQTVDTFDRPIGRDDKPFQSSAPYPELVKLAEKNDPHAEYELSRMYAYGHGVTQSPQEERKWLERSARHGNVEAQYELGLALRDGHGVVQDYQQARKWMQLAADANNASAQYALGEMYRSGVGVPIDNVKAYVWLNLAAAQGVPGATAARDIVLSKLSAAELQEGQAESRRISERHEAKDAQPAQ
jgi:TPR repeat protein